MSRRPTLVDQISENLRSELAAGTYPPGSRLPTEAELGSHFEVSRPTIRAAIRALETLGLVSTRHGVGTFVTENQRVSAGLNRLESITESIRDMGKTPSMVYESRLKRPALPDEAETMRVLPTTQVVELRRTILADGVVVAYSYDLLPAELFPPGFDIAEIKGSIFSFLTGELGITPVIGKAEIHAVHSEHVGWGPEAKAHKLFVLLNQLHYDSSDRIVLHSRTYFIEGRYEFSINRHA